MSWHKPGYLSLLHILLLSDLRLVNQGTLTLNPEEKEEKEEEDTLHTLSPHFQTIHTLTPQVMQNGLTQAKQYLNWHNNGKNIIRPQGHQSRGTTTSLR